MEENQVEYIKYLVARKLSDTTIKNYCYYYKKFAEGLEQHNLNQKYVDNFVLRWNDSKARAFLKSLFEFYDIREFRIIRPSGRKPIKKHRTISQEEFKALRNYLYSHHGMKYGILLEISFYCGLRRSEATSVIAEDFEWEEWSKDTSRPCKLKIRGKGSRERYVLIPSPVMKRVLKYAQIKRPLTTKFFVTDGERWNEVFTGAVKKCCTHHYTTHDLRRSCATNWFKEGKDIVQVKTRLGHSKIDTTLLYLNVDEEKMLDDWEKELSEK